MKRLAAIARIPAIAAFASALPVPPLRDLRERAWPRLGDSGGAPQPIGWASALDVRPRRQRCEEHIERRPRPHVRSRSAATTDRAEPALEEAFRMASNPAISPVNPSIPSG